ncbi:MAG: hypothetical protein ACI9V1_001032 [Spirosomataceae bacterium]|jgi:uncharacterized protein (DUF58 family)
MHFLLQFYLTNRFFAALAACVVILCFGVLLTPLFWLGQAGISLLVVGAIIEGIILFWKEEIVKFERVLPAKLSNGDDNKIWFTVQNKSANDLNARLLEDFPEQLQLHNWEKRFSLQPNKQHRLSYTIHPTERGEYNWRNSQLFLETNRFKLVTRRCVFPTDEIIPCYPSFEQFKELRISALVNSNNEANSTMIRKIGQSLEFEQIKNYVGGDDFRHINWKASAKQGKLMLNQYQEERSQDIYSVIDLGRNMQQPFNGQTLLDYSINASLALTKTVLSLKDKVGLITYSADECTVLPPRSDVNQFKKVNEKLYSISSDFQESGMEKLYRFVRYRVRQRGLFVIFSNFDTIQSLHRNLPYLRAIAKYHLVLLVIFENSELESYAEETATDVKEIYDKTMAKHLLFQKRLIAKEISKFGMQSLVTKPEMLNSDLINKYLNIKRRQML